MSSDTDHPRQRTVAELLAQHGDANATGRRRRRREPDDGSDEGGAAPVGRSAPPAPELPPPPAPRTGRRRADREPDPWEQEPRSWDQQPPRRAPEPAPWDSGPQGWESSEWDAPQREDRWDAQPPPQPPDVQARDAQARDVQPREIQPRRSRAREREPQGWEPDPPARDLQAWDSGPQAREPRSREPLPREPLPREPMPREVPPPRAAAGASPVRDRPTDLLPRVRDEEPRDLSLTGPIQPHLVADGYESDGYDRDGYDPDDEGPPTMIGAAPVGAEAWHRERTGGRPGPAPDDDDGGPPTQAAAPLDLDDRPAGTGGRRYDDSDSFSDGFEDFYGGGQEGRPPMPVERTERINRNQLPERFPREDHEPDGFFDSGESEAVEDDEQPGRRGKPAAAVSDSAGQAWAAVLAQWIAGAVGGAALWVGFRFLWRELPVVAIAAAALVTVGLVVVVRALLRNDDMRTTMFAVLVGLLLTVSPAILVLLGR